MPGLILTAEEENTAISEAVWASSFYARRGDLVHTLAQAGTAGDLCRYCSVSMKATECVVRHIKLAKAMAEHNLGLLCKHSPMVDKVTVNKAFHLSQLALALARILKSWMSCHREN